MRHLGALIVALATALACEGCSREYYCETERRHFTYACAQHRELASCDADFSVLYPACAPGAVD